MTRIIIAIVALIIAVVGGAAGFLFVYQPAQERGFVEAAEAATSAQAYDAAVQNYQQALSVLPDSARSLDQSSYYGLATAHLLNENYQAALDNFAKVEDQSDPAITAGKKDAYLGLFDYPNAINELTVLIDSNEGELRQRYLRERADLYALNLQPAEALADREALYAADPAGEAELGLDLLATYQASGDRVKLLDHSHDLIENGVSAAAPYLVRGRLSLETGAIEAAQADFVAGLAQEQTSDLQGLVAFTYWMQGDLSAARSAAEAGGEDRLAQGVLGTLNGDLNRLNDLYLSIDQATLPYLLYLRGLTLSGAGYPNAAVSDADQLIAQFPDLMWGHLLKGEALLALDGVPQALTALGDGLAIEPESLDLLLQRGRAYVAEETWSSARLDIDAVLAVRPDSPTGLLTLAQIEAGNSEDAAALATLERLLADTVSTSPAVEAAGRQLKADLLIAAGDWEEAIGELNLLLDAASDDVDLLWERALAYQALGQDGAAVEDLSAALSIDPRDLRLYGARIDSYIALSNLEAAVQDGRLALQLERDYPPALLAEGLFAVQEEKYFDAIINLSDALEEDDTLAIAYAARAEARFWQNEPDRTRADANQALDLDDQLPQAYMARALAEAYEQEWRDAIQDADVAVDLAPEDATTVANRGLIYLDAGDYNEALDDFDRAIELDDSNPDWHLFRATTLSELQRHEEAKLALSQGIELADQETVSGITTIELGESLLADLERIPDPVEGLRTWSDPYHRFSITYPEAWRQFVDPGFSTPLRLEGPLDGNYRANLLVAVIEDINLTTSQLSRAFDPPSTLPNFEQVSSGNISIGGRSGIRKVFTWTAVDERLRETPVTVIQTYALSQGRALIFTATIRSEDVEKYEPIFDEIFASFTLE